MKQIEMLLTDPIDIQCHSNQIDIDIISGINISSPHFINNDNDELWDFDGYITWESYQKILNAGNKLFSTIIKMVDDTHKEFQCHIRQVKMDFVKKIGLYTVRFYEITNLEYGRVVYRDGYSIQIG